MSLKLNGLRSPFGEDRRTHRIGILKPLRVRDFGLLWSGMTVSALGDGIYTVALAWQVYGLSNTPTALSIVGIAWFLPQIAATLFGGVIADRMDRRRVMIFADVLRATAIGALGALSVAGELHLWHIWILVALYGIGNSVFYPAYTALVPQVLPKELLVEGAALRQFIRPLASRIIGPARGGALVAAVALGSLVTGQIPWEAMLQHCVPGELLGRVASVDSFVSSGLIPLSLAITGPVAAAVGAVDTLRWSGVISGGILIAFLVLAVGLRATEGREPEPAT
jgi:MFS family permease